MSRRGFTIEGSSDHFFVVDYSELLVQFVAVGEPGGADALLVAVGLKKQLRDAQGSPGSLSQNPSQKGIGSLFETP